MFIYKKKLTYVYIIEYTPTHVKWVLFNKVKHVECRLYAVNLISEY